MSSKRHTPEPRADQLRQYFSDLAGTSISFRLGSYRAELIYWGVIPPRWWRNYLHEHSFFEACYAYRGRGTFNVLGEERRVSAGDLFVARPREAHEVISSRTSPLGVYYWAYSLNKTSARSLAPADDVIDALVAAYALAGRPIARLGRHFERTLLGLAEELAGTQPGYLQAVHALALKLLVDTARAVTDTSQIAATVTPPPPAGNPEIAQIIVRYLQDNFSNRIEVRDVASQVHLSERHVSRLFRQAIGVSILGYLTRLRIETACKLLLEDQLSIKQVARAVGYPDSHYFTTLFGRSTGMTPAAYRRCGGKSG